MWAFRKKTGETYRLRGRMQWRGGDCRFKKNKKSLMKPVDEDRISTWFSLPPIPIAPKKQLPTPSLCLCLCINTNSFYLDTKQHHFLVCSCLPESSPCSRCLILTSDTLASLFIHSSHSLLDFCQLSSSLEKNPDQSSLSIGPP